MLRSTGLLLLALGLALPVAAAPRAARPHRNIARGVLPEAVSDAAIEGHLSGDFSRLKRILAAAPPNAVNRSGQSALFFAVNSGQPELVRALLNRGANPNHLTPYGSSAFTLLNFYQPETPAILRMLLERGARPELRLPGEATPLMLVADSGNGPAVRMLLARGANPNAVTKDGETPLYYASRVDSVEAVSALLAAGAKINHQTKSGDTPLGRAAICGNSGVFRLLLSRGANPRFKNREGYSVLYFAVLGGSPSILRTVLKLGFSPREVYPDGQTPLLTALAMQREETVAELLKAGVDPNVADAEGVTPLMHAAAKGSEELVQLLLQRGADVHRKAKDGTTAMVRAKSADRFSRNPAVIDLLKQAGAVVPEVDLATAVTNDDLEGVQGALARGENPNQMVEAPQGMLGGLFNMLRAAGRGDDPNQALEKAFDPNKVPKAPVAFLALQPLGGNPEVLEALLQAGADANAKDTEGATLLMRAAEMGRVDAAELLLARGAQIGERDAAGNSALTLAVQGGGLDMVRFLLEKGADPKSRTQSGHSTLHLAIAMFGLRDQVSAELISLLVEKGADVNAAMDEGVTPLMLAAMMPPPEAAFDPPGKDADPATRFSQAMRQSTRKMLDAARKAAAEQAAEEEKAVPGEAPAGEQPEEEAPAGPLDKLAKAMLAPVWTKTELMKYLLAHGADPNQTVGPGVNAMMLVIESWSRHKKPEGPLLRLLVEAGAKVNAVHPKSATPLAMAAGRGNLGAVKALFALQADPNVKLSEGWTALHVAVMARQPQVAELLIRQGAEVNARIDSGSTPLILAVENNDPRLVSLLLAKRADVQVVGADGMTPLKLARQHRNRSLEAMLKKAGAR